MPTPTDVALTEIEPDDLATVVRDIDGLRVVIEIRGFPFRPKDPNRLCTGHRAPYDERTAGLQPVAVIDDVGINQVTVGGLHAEADKVCLTWLPRVGKQLVEFAPLGSRGRSATGVDPSSAAASQSSPGPGFFPPFVETDSRK